MLVKFTTVLVLDRPSCRYEALCALNRYGTRIQLRNDYRYRAHGNAMLQKSSRAYVVRVISPINIAFPHGLDFHDKFLSCKY